MVESQVIKIDGVKWWINSTNGVRTPSALCLQHNLRLEPKPDLVFRYSKYVIDYPSTAKKLECAEGPHIIEIPRELSKEQTYVINRVDALVFAQMKVLNLDDEAIPVAKEELKGSSYWIKSKVTESKSGTRLIIWAGDKSKKNKTQLFIEPQLKRLSFDQNDDHPIEVFASVEVRFANDVKSSIKKEK